MPFLVFVWLGVAAVMVVLELISLGLTTIWFAGAAIVAAILAYLNVSLIVQLIAFAIIALVLLIFTRPIAEKHLLKENVKTNVESIPGMSGIVTEAINNIKNEGAVLVDGKEWTARTADNSTIEKDEEIIVSSVSGVKLIVERK